MKFTFDRDAVAKELSIAQEIISSKNQASIMSNIMLTAENNTLTITATDSLISFQTSVPVEIIEEGTTVVFCSKFLEILSSLPIGCGEIEFIEQRDEIDGTPVSILIKPISKRVKFELSSLTSEKFPETKIEAETPYFDIPAKELKAMIQQTIFAVSTDEMRRFLNGVYFVKEENKFRLVATDAKRMSLAEREITTDIPDFPSAIVPTKILSILQKHAPDEGMISVAITDESIFLKFGGYKFASLLINGSFPAYQRVIPTEQKYTLKLQKSDLVDAIRRMTIMTDKKTERIFLDINPGVLRVMSSQSEQGHAEEEIPCEYASDSMTIALNYKYLDQPLRVMSSENAAIEFTQEMRAITLRPEPAEDYFHIIMPMQKE